MNKYHFYLLSALFILTLPHNSFAADVYQWTDAQGHRVIGSNPPKNAANLKAFKTKPLSRYNSDRMLGRMGSTRPQAQSSNKPAVVNSNKIPAELSSKQIEIIKDELGEVLEYTVEVSNLGTETAHGVRVQFKLNDGNTYLATGPVELAGGSNQRYILKKDGLAETPGPEVMIDYY